MASADLLATFSPATRAWFSAAFDTPTPVQLGAWQAIARGEHALVVAPTGSGKTLAAFLWALDRLAAQPAPAEPNRRCRVLYISPLKALAVDVERNLRAPLIGIRQAASRLDLPLPDVRVGVRSGDTSPEDRRALTRLPPDVLITTPESLYLLLTSQARAMLAGVQTVVIDEVHALAGSKRGAHLAVSLERLEHLLAVPAQRVGLSATVRPVEEVARWLGGSGRRPVKIIQPPSHKIFDLQVVVPVPDMADLDGAGAADPVLPGQPAPGRAAEPDLTGSAAGAIKRASIWPHVEERIVDLISEHRSTLVFANSRRLAERLTARLNEVWEERQAELGPLDADPGLSSTNTGPPALTMGPAGSSHGASAVLARAHHGSVSKEQRAIIEGELKAGRLPAVVATSTLELGIDMGAIDLVIQVESPPSVASGLQRVGRAGHQVNAVSRGVIFPKYRSDLVQTAVVVERMRAGQIEALQVPTNPLDVLAQQIVAMVAMDEWAVDDLETLIRRAAPFTTLSRALLESVLDMLSGRYPSEEFAELRPRIIWDRLTGSLTGRPGAQRLAVTSGGTIADRGLYGVFLVGGDERRPGRRVGELDEEMVYESRVGDVFTLGSSSWRIEEITPDRVLVTPAPGQPGRLPFWRGDALGRPAELGRAVGAFVRELVHLDDAAAAARVAAAGLDPWAADNLIGYLREQQHATRHVPDDRTLVIERFRDELGDWRVVIHSPFGGQLHAPWALAIAARFRQRFGVEVQAMHGDDGIVLRLPDLETDDGRPPEIADLLTLEPDDVEPLVTDELGGSALFASRFRECAGRALLLPRRRPGQRQPLWQQRQRAAQLLQVASRFATFPIVLETIRECIQDVFDVPGLVVLMRDLAARRVRVVELETTTPSPFARSLLFGYVAQFLYEGDSPLAERRAAALSLDPELLAELLGRGAGAQLRDLLDPAAVERTEAELQRLLPRRRLIGAEGAADLLRLLGPLDTAEVAARVSERYLPAESPPETAPAGQSSGDHRPDEPQAASVGLAGRWLVDLEGSRRVIRVRIAGTERWAAVEDAGRLRDALGTPLPVGVAEAFTEPVADPLGELLSRFARTHGPFTALEVAQRFGLGSAVVLAGLRRLVEVGRLVEGALRPLPISQPADPTSQPADPTSNPDQVTAAADRHPSQGNDFCDSEVLRTIRRRSLAALRAEVEPVPVRDLARFLPGWQGIGGTGRGSDEVLRSVEQLAGALLPASAVETLILPARVRGYSPSIMDELTAAGDVVWSGHGRLPGDDGWVSLHPADLAPLTLAAADPTLELDVVHRAILSALGGGGAFFFRPLGQAVAAALAAEPAGDSQADQRFLDDGALTEALWDLLWGGLITNDTLAPLRARLATGRTTHRSKPLTPRLRPGAGRFAALRAARAAAGRPGMPARGGPATAAGRWSLLPQREADPTLRAHALAEILLERHGVLTRGAVLAEGVTGGFSTVYRTLSAFEDAGRVRRGYFIEGLGAAQFGTTGAVDRLRATSNLAGAAAAPGPGSRQASVPSAVVLAAADPANPFGAALPWPNRPTDLSAPAEPDSAVLQGHRPRTGHKPGRKAGAVVVVVDGELVLYVERGGRSLLSWTEQPPSLEAAADALVLAVREGALGRLTVERADGVGVLWAGHPLVDALAAAGFHATPRGLRIRG